MRFEQIIKKAHFSLSYITDLRGRNCIPCFRRLQLEEHPYTLFFANCSCEFLKYHFECQGKKHFKCVFVNKHKSGRDVIICWNSSSCTWRKPEIKTTGKNSTCLLSFSPLTDDLCCCDLDRDKDNSSANRGDWSTEYSKIGNQWQRSSQFEVFDAISAKNVAREDKFPARWVHGGQFHTSWPQCTRIFAKFGLRIQMVIKLSTKK